MRYREGRNAETAQERHSMHSAWPVYLPHTTSSHHAASTQQCANIAQLGKPTQNTATATEAQGPEHNPGQREQSTSQYASTAQCKEQSREGNFLHSRAEILDSNAFCLHKKCINPHSSSHLYSFIGLWCPLNQSLKGCPTGQSPTHQRERGGGVTPHHSLSRHCSTETQTERKREGGVDVCEGLF